MEWCITFICLHACNSIDFDLAIVTTDNELVSVELPFDLFRFVLFCFVSFLINIDKVLL